MLNWRVYVVEDDMARFSGTTWTELPGICNETLDGGKLLVLFRSVGISIRMENKINVEKDGKFISIADKFKKTTNDD